MGLTAIGFHCELAKIWTSKCVNDPEKIERLSKLAYEHKVGEQDHDGYAPAPPIVSYPLPLRSRSLLTIS